MRVSEIRVKQRTEQTTKFLFLTYYNWLQLQIVSIFLQISLIDLNATNLKYPTNYLKIYVLRGVFVYKKKCTLILIAVIYWFLIGNT